MNKNDEILFVEDDGEFIIVPVGSIEAITYIGRVLAIKTYECEQPYEMDCNRNPIDTIRQQLTPHEITVTTPPLKKLKINRINRRLTRNSNSSYWQLYDDETNQQVNVFKHNDPVKDNFHIVVAAGYANLFNNLIVDQERSFIPPVTVTVTNDGEWNKLVSIDDTPLTPLVESNKPDIDPNDSKIKNPEISDEIRDRANAALEALRNSDLNMFDDVEDESAT